MVSAICFGCVLEYNSEIVKEDNARLASYLYGNGILVGEMVNQSISLEEYYLRTMAGERKVV